MAHSWVMAHEDELTAFSRYTAVHGPRSILLIDTYDSIAAARLIVDAGLRPAAVRLDSGDLARLSRAVRDILDAGGLVDTHIFVSGDLDEHNVAALVSARAPIDSFGVGTALSTSNDAPALSGVYKLVEIDRAGTMTPVMKLSADKRTCPGTKQLWRVYGPEGPVGDVVGLAGEAAPDDGEPLLTCVVRGGVRQQPSRRIDEIRDACQVAVARLPKGVRRHRDAAAYPVALSPALERLADKVAADQSHRQLA
jgi:nicotinate phosphoribosyltransferase